MSTLYDKPDPIAKALALYDFLNEMSTALWEAFEADFLERILPEILGSMPPDDDLFFDSTEEDGEDIPF